MAQMSDGFGGLPTRNFSAGHYEEVEDISGETMREFLLERGKPSDPSHACMAGCTIKCSNVFGGEDGKMIVSPLEYETIGLMGSNLGINSLDTVARMNWQVNDLGLDSIEIGAALGVAAEAGLMQWGDGERAMELLDEIRKGTELGCTLGDGAVATGKKYGIERVPAVKGQAMSAYEPRSIKGTGVTYAVSPQGADHTAGLTIRAKVNHLDPTVQKDPSLNAQLNMAGLRHAGRVHLCRVWLRRDARWSGEALVAERVMAGMICPIIFCRHWEKKPSRWNVSSIAVLALPRKMTVCRNG